MDEYKSNSNKSKREIRELPEKKVEKAITGTAKVRKKSEVRKFADVFISEDVDSVKSYILLDVIVPAAKKLISDVVTNGIDAILYGESGKTKASGASKISYHKIYEKDDKPRQYSNIHRTRTGYQYEDIIVETRGEAESVLERMDELVSMYGMVSVADMYDLMGVTAQYTDNNYGWTNIRAAEIRRIRDGYVIKMPKVMPID